MTGKASAPGAATVINAIATLNGCAFGIDLRTYAEVELIEESEWGVEGEIREGGDATLIETCVEKVLERSEYDGGARVVTESDIPMASGLKSSSAAANASVLAAMDALSRDSGTAVDYRDGEVGERENDVDGAADGKYSTSEGGAVPRETVRGEAVRIGVEAARDVGVTITGAFDDATASMYGGVCCTDNSEDELLRREEYGNEVAVYVPDATAKSADTDVERSRKVGSPVDRAFELALEGEYGDAMSINGFAYCAALGFDPSPAVEVMDICEGAGLSGTGPSYSAVGDGDEIEHVVELWEELEGKVFHLQTDNVGASYE
ncbi:MAG: shikimate kinase [Halobacteria archaeon]